MCQIQPKGGIENGQVYCIPRLELYPLITCEVTVLILSWSLALYMYKKNVNENKSIRKIT